MSLRLGAHEAILVGDHRGIDDVENVVLAHRGEHLLLLLRLDQLVHRIANLDRGGLGEFAIEEFETGVGLLHGANPQQLVGALHVLIGPLRQPPDHAI